MFGLFSLFGLFSRFGLFSLFGLMSTLGRFSAILIAPLSHSFFEVFPPPDPSRLKRLRKTDLAELGKFILQSRETA